MLLDQVVEQSGFTGSGTLVFGELGTDHETQLVCGHFTFDENANHPLIDALPSHIHIENYGEAAGGWMENTLRVIGAEAGRGQMGGDLIATKLSEIIFAQALRTYLNTEGIKKSGLAGFADTKHSPDAEGNSPGSGIIPGRWMRCPRLPECRARPLRSSSPIIMPTTPLGYITQWRMQIARQLLAETSTPIIESRRGRRLPIGSRIRPGFQETLPDGTSDLPPAAPKLRRSARWPMRSCRQYAVK